MKTNHLTSLLAGVALFVNGVIAQPLQINVAALPPFPSQAGTYFNNPARFFNVAITNTSPKDINNWIGLRIEMTFPDRIILETPLNIPPYRPLTIGAYQTVILDQLMFRQLLGHLELNNLLTRGIRLARFETGEGNLMPEGTYNACITAYEFNPHAGTPILASAPGTGCTSFTICYTASTPEILTPTACQGGGMSMPVRGTDGMVTMTDNVLQPVNPLLITWKPPMFNCAGTPATFLYQVKMVHVMPGQNIQSAIDYNPVLLQLDHVLSPTAQIDTNLFANMLRAGERYALQVTASPTAGNDNITMANQGKSPVCSFVWGSPPAIVMPPVATVPEEPAEEPAEEPEPEPRPEPEIIHETITECEPALANNINKQFFSTNDLAGKEIQIGHFTVNVQQALLDNQQYQGNGYVSWSPFGSPINIKVTFNNIKINEQYQVYDGEIFSDTIDLVDYVPGYIQKSYGWAESKLDQYKRQYGLNLPSYRNKAQRYYDMLKEPARRLHQGLNGGPFTLPLSISTTYHTTPIDIGIIGMIFTPTSAKMNTMAVFEVPESGITSPWLTFVGQGFCFTPDKLLFEQQGNLFLAGDFEVEFNDNTRMIFEPATELGNMADGTLITWNASGFDLASIQCQMQFPSDHLVADDGQGNILQGAPVSATFRAQFSDWNDWIASASMEPFQVAGMPEFTFTPMEITYDNSAGLNAADMIFPSKYPANEKNNSWKGLFIKNIQVELPRDFGRFDAGSDNRATIQVSNMLVDGGGVSCDINKTNIIDLSSGNLGGWAFSMDSLKVNILFSAFDQIRVAGLIRVPGLDEELKYGGFLMEDTEGKLDYGFAIRPEEHIEMGMWLASLSIHNSSGLTIRKDDYGAEVSLLMHGNISIVNVQHGDVSFSFEEIEFQNFGISNRHPVTGREEFYFDIGSWSSASPQKSLGPFNFTFEKPAFKKTGNTYYGLEINGIMNIAEKFRSDVSLTIDGEIELKPGITAPEARFRGVEVTELYVSGEFKPVYIEGRFTFFRDDPVFGSGVRGEVEATFEPLFKVDSRAMFGSKSDFSYWYVDAGVAFSPPVEAFPLAFGGFSGGIWYNMEGVNFSDEAGTQLKNGTGDGGSGVNYVPKNNSWGLKAGVTLTLSNALGGGNVFNGSAWVTCAFNGSSFSSISITGETFAITDYPDNGNALFTGPFEISFHLEKSEFSFWFDPKIEFQFLGAKATVPISMWANYDSRDWFFKIGDPGIIDKRISVTLLDWDKGPIEAFLGANAYFALGNALDFNLPELPSEVARFLNVPPRRTQPASLGAGGMMVGAHLEGRFKFDMVLYASLTVLAGFDVTLYHDPSAVCLNGQPMGYNGWYGMGQVYAYLSGEMGLHINVWFFKGKVTLARLTAGALMMGGMPDPFWAYGVLKVQARVLGGLIKVNTSLEMEYGDICVPPGSNNPLNQIKILEAVQPGYERIEEARAANPEIVFTRPRIIANVNLSDGGQNPQWPIALADTTNTRAPYIRYQFFIDEVRHYVGPNSESVEDANFRSNMEFRRNLYEPTIVELANPDVRGYFEPEKMHKITVSASALQYYSAQNKWDFPTIDGKRQKHIESIESYFKTDKLPGDLKQQIAFSWPLNGQRFLTPDETQFHASLIGNRDDLLKDNEEARVEAWIRKVDPTTSESPGVVSYEKKLAYNVLSVLNSHYIIFIMNQSELESSTYYELSLVRVNKALELDALDKLAQENRKIITRNLLQNQLYNHMITDSRPSSQSLEGITTKTYNDVTNIQSELSPINITLASSLLLASSTSSGSTLPTISSPTTLPEGQVSGPVPVNPGNLALQPLLTAGTSVSQPNLTDQIAGMHREILQNHIAEHGIDTVLDQRAMTFLHKLRNDYVDTIAVIFFKTSRFRTIKDKVNSYGIIYREGSSEILKSAASSEPFEHYDLYGIPQDMALSLGYHNAIPPIYQFSIEFDPDHHQHLAWKEQFSDGIHKIDDLLEKAEFIAYPGLQNTPPGGLKMEWKNTENRLTTSYPIRPQSARNPLDYWPGTKHFIYQAATDNCPLTSNNMPAPVTRQEVNTGFSSHCSNIQLRTSLYDVFGNLKGDYDAYRNFKEKFNLYGIQFLSIPVFPPKTEFSNYDARLRKAREWITANTIIKGGDFYGTNVSLPINHLLRLASLLEERTYPATTPWSTSTPENMISTINQKSRSENQAVWDFFMSIPPEFPSRNKGGNILMKRLDWNNSENRYFYEDLIQVPKIPFAY